MLEGDFGTQTAVISILFCLEGTNICDWSCDSLKKSLAAPKMDSGDRISISRPSHSAVCIALRDSLKLNSLFLVLVMLSLFRWRSSGHQWIFMPDSLVCIQSGLPKSVFTSQPSQIQNYWNAVRADVKTSEQSHNVLVVPLCLNIISS